MSSAIQDVFYYYGDCPGEWRKIYVCSPYAGDTKKNVEAARGYCRYVLAEGGIPIAPHLLFPQFMDDNDEDERELGLIFAKLLLKQCDEVWVFGDHISKGMFGECRLAILLNKKMQFFNSECEETTAQWLLED